MLHKFTRYTVLIARICIDPLFILAGIGKIIAFEETQAYIEVFNLPSLLLMPTIIFELYAGLLLFLGFYTRHVAFLLAGFTLISALIFHTDFNHQVQIVMFLKNIAIIGGLLLLVGHQSESFPSEKS